LVERVHSDAKAQIPKTDFNGSRRHKVARRGGLREQSCSAGDQQNGKDKE
jgi:hypothetical protein